MTAAGYSGTPLAQKLGYRPDTKVHFINAPAGYARTLGPLPRGVVLARSLRGPLDAVHLFTASRRELAARLPKVLAALQPAGMLWVSWPKKAARLPTDITEDVIRAVALPLGVVDVKVCAVDEVWSGLKLVRRLENRAAPAARRAPRAAHRAPTHDAPRTTHR